MDTDTIGSWSSTRKGNVVAHSAMLAMATWFMSNKTCHVGGGFCLIHMCYFFTGCYNLHYYAALRCSYGAPRVWNWRTFIIRLIPGSPPSACRLESLGTRLQALTAILKIWDSQIFQLAALTVMTSAFPLAMNVVISCSTVRGILQLVWSRGRKEALLIQHSLWYITSSIGCIASRANFWPHIFKVHSLCNLPSSQRLRGDFC